MLYVHQSFLEAKPIFAGDFLPQKPTPDFTVDKLQKGRKEKILVNTNSYGFELDTVKRTKSLKTRDVRDTNLPVSRPRYRRTQSNDLRQGLGITSPRNSDYLTEIPPKKCSWPIVSDQSERRRFVI